MKHRRWCGKCGVHESKHPERWPKACRVPPVGKQKGYKIRRRNRG